MAIKLTENAAREVKVICEQQNLDLASAYLRVGVKGGGCSGFSYVLDLTETKQENDELWSFTFTLAPKAVSSAKTNGGTAVAVEGEGEAEGESITINVISDPKSHLYLKDTVIDFKDEIMGRGFVFQNPNATSTCGCGSSFSA